MKRFCALIFLISAAVQAGPEKEAARCVNCRQQKAEDVICIACQSGLCTLCEQDITKKGPLYFEEGTCAYFVRVQCKECRQIIALLGTPFSPQRMHILQERARKDNCEYVHVVGQAECNDSIE